MKKKWIAAFTALALVLASPSAVAVSAQPAESWESPFIDVSTSDWFYEAVEFTVNRKIMIGTSATTFAPLLPTTRGTLVTMLYRLDRIPPITTENPFTDVPADKWYADGVTWAAGSGIVDGFPDGTFRPEEKVTREQLVTILQRFAVYKGFDTSVNPNVTVYGFKDMDSIHSYALNAVRWGIDKGILFGINDFTLSPLTDADRAQVATMIMRVVQYLGM